MATWEDPFLVIWDNSLFQSGGVWSPSRQLALMGLLTNFEAKINTLSGRRGSWMGAQFLCFSSRSTPKTVLVERPSACLGSRLFQNKAIISFLDEFSIKKGVKRLGWIQSDSAISQTLQLYQKLVLNSVRFCHHQHPIINSTKKLWIHHYYIISITEHSTKVNYGRLSSKFVDFLHNPHRGPSLHLGQWRRSG